MCPVPNPQLVELSKKEKGYANRLNPKTKLFINMCARVYSYFCHLIEIN